MVDDLISECETFQTCCVLFNALKAPTILLLGETSKQKVERGRVDVLLIRATGSHPGPGPRTVAVLSAGPKFVCLLPAC